MAGRLDGKVAVITGGANGIGRACARRFSEEGASIVIGDLQPEAGAVTVAEIEAAGGVASFVQLDVTSPAQNAELASAAVERHGTIDILLTAAGVSTAGYVSGDIEGQVKHMTKRAEVVEANPAAAITDLDVDDFRRVLEVNLTGTLLAVQAATRVMVDQAKPGAIVTIASIAAVDPLWGEPSYPVSKAGVWMLTKNASRILAPLGIRVNAIGPGFIDTNMTAAFDEVDAFNDVVIGGTPMGRKGTPTEVANVALFLASDEASFVTGELIHPDGGWFTG